MLNPEDAGKEITSLDLRNHEVRGYRVGSACERGDGQRRGAAHNAPW